MIIDLVLNRKDGKAYNPKEFYNEVNQYGSIGFDITGAMDSGTEEQVKRSLARYIVNENYNLDIIAYINSQNWLTLN